MNEDVESLLDEGTGIDRLGKEGRLTKIKLGEYAVLMKKR